MRSDRATNDNAPRPRWPVIAWWIAVAVALAIVAPVEWARLRAAIASPGGPLVWLFDGNLDTTPFAMWLLLLPIAWWLRRPLFEHTPGWWNAWRERLAASPRHRDTVAGSGPEGRPGSGSDRATSENPFPRTAWLCALFVAAVAFTTHAWIGTRIGDLPSAYHDESSYLFQAKTFLAGRWSYPSHEERPRLFDQYHVLNDGRMAGRYFPATAAWIAPFLAAGVPKLGHWLAGALAAVLVFWSGRELRNTLTGLLAGALTALAPAVALFGNMFLAHHPTLLGLTAFLYFFLRLRRTGAWWCAPASGTGLAFAMLARPMTAFGFALPLGAWFAYWLATNRSFSFEARALRSRLQHACGFAIPLAAGFLIVALSNSAITGSVWETPYQRYTNLHTPRHVYGFDNVTRGERNLGPRVLDAYDRWTRNLDAQLAVENVRSRWIASWQWSLGIVPLTIATAVFLLRPRARDPAWWAVAAAIVSLHAVHVPYWYDGILHFHYVFETIPLWMLLFAGVTVELWNDWRTRERPWMPAWWSGLVATAVLVNWTPLPPLWNVTRLDVEIANQTAVRRAYAGFHDVIDEVVREPAVVVVRRGWENPHVDYVVNEPGLNAPLLIGRYREDDFDAARLRATFPNRSPYRVDVHEIFTRSDAERVPPPAPGMQRFVRPHVVVDVQPLRETPRGEP